MDIPIEASNSQWTLVNPVTYLFQFLAAYGWFLVGTASILIYLVHKLRPSVDRWKQAKEDAEYHKNPDKALAAMEAVKRARDRQQQLLEAASQRALEQQKEREEKKKAEAIERMRKCGPAGGGRLGSAGDDYLPLSGGASTSSYKPPKRSACAKGGCGK